MPKIGKINLLYDGDDYRCHEIYYKRKEGFCIKGLSEEFIGLTGFNPEHHSAEYEMVEKVQKACRLFRELKTKATLVIMYKCVASTALRMNQVSDGHYLGLLKGVSDKIHATNLSECLATFGVDFEVAQLIDDGVNKKYYRVDQITKVPTRWEIKGRNGYQVMEFTEERYLFFMEILEGMKKMVRSASIFFGAEPKVAELFIENKHRLLELSNSNE